MVEYQVVIRVLPDGKIKRKRRRVQQNKVKDCERIRLDDLNSLPYRRCTSV